MTHINSENNVVFAKVGKGKKKIGKGNKEIKYK